MNKQTKGALAAGGAAVLLLGGMGSLAYWQETASGAGATITTGTLVATANNDGVWTDSFNNGTASTVPTVGSFLAVPGDTLTYTQTFTVTGTGNNLHAKVTFPSTTSLLPGISNLTGATQSYQAKIAGGALADVTSGNSTNLSITAGTANTITAVYTLTWPLGSTSYADTSQGQALTLSALPVTVTQTAS